MRQKAIVLGFYITAALVNAALALQYALGGYVSYIILFLLVVHFGLQIVHGIQVQTVSKRYGILLGIVGFTVLGIVEFFYGLALRSFTKLYMVYLSVSRKHLDYTAVWPAKWYVVSIVTVLLVFSATLFRILHWPGAVQAAFIGFGLRSLFFVYIGYYKAFTPVVVEDEVEQIGKG